MTDHVPASWKPALDPVLATAEARALGGWGRDWRMASYLLFEAPYLHDLMALGYEDGCRARARLEAFLQG